MLEDKSGTPPANPDTSDDEGAKKDLGNYSEIPRFQKLYWEKKEAERQLKERDESILELKTLLVGLDTRLDGLETAPDPTENPDAFKEYVTKQAERKVEREKLLKKEKAEPPRTEGNKAPYLYDYHTKEDIEELERIERELRIDAEIPFETVAGVAFNKIHADPRLAARLYSDPNPVKAIYEYGERLIKNSKDSKDDLLSRGNLNSGGRSDELPNTKTKYVDPYTGKPMTDLQVEMWKRQGLSMEKITPKK